MLPLPERVALEGTAVDVREPGAAALVAGLFALAPAAFGGIRLRASPGAERDRWLSTFRATLGVKRPWIQLPAQVDDGRLLGGLDLTATLAVGRPIESPGLLAEADDGVLVVSMAERMSRMTCAHLCQTMDRGAVQLARDGLHGLRSARIALIALDEGLDEDEALAQPLQERLAFHVDLRGPVAPDVDQLREALGLTAVCAHGAAEGLTDCRESIDSVTIDEDAIAALCACAQSLGLSSLRIAAHAVLAARASAALCGRGVVSEVDLGIAASLVLAPRAELLPTQPPDAGEPASSARQSEPVPQSCAEPPTTHAEDHCPARGDGGSGDSLEQRVVNVARAHIPEGLLQRLRHVDRSGRVPPGAGGRSCALHLAAGRGRPSRTQSGRPGAGNRLDLVATLCAAAPWQRLRAQTNGTPSEAGVRRVAIRGSDLRVTRFKRRSPGATVFIVDASGSTAAQRLAEAKGAVELLLADCYVRRDMVAMIAFRGQQAERVLEPTRSLTRARRLLAGLPGGGGTPLAAAVEAGQRLASDLQRRGVVPSLVFLTDARANVTRDGKAGREQARVDAHRAARVLGQCGFGTLLVDTAARPSVLARELAGSMNGDYLPMPHACATRICEAAQALRASLSVDGADRAR